MLAIDPRLGDGELSALQVPMHGMTQSLAQATMPPRTVRRVLFFGKNMSRTRCTGALVDALTRHGLQVKWINYSTVRRWLTRPQQALRWVRRRFERFDPDMVMVFCRDLPEVLVREFRAHAPVVLWVEESLHDVEPEHLAYLTQADLVCASNPARIPMLLQAGVRRAVFLMSGFSPRYHHPNRAREPVRDLVFMGGPGIHGLRAEFLAKVSEHYDTAIFGVGWEDWRRRFPRLNINPPVKTRAFRRLCTESRIVLGLNQVNNDALYFSNRTWLALACRAFHLTHYVPGLETVLQEGEHLAWYHDADECLQKIGEYLGRPAERERVAESGCAMAHQSHQYFHRVARILEIVRGVQDHENGIVGGQHAVAGIGYFGNGNSGNGRHRRLG